MIRDEENFAVFYVKSLCRPKRTFLRRSAEHGSPLRPMPEESRVIYREDKKDKDGHCFSFLPFT